MTTCGLYFGNSEHMSWVGAPDSDAGAASTGWGATGGFINGGAYVRRSLNHHKVYNLGWTMKRYDTLRPLLDFYEGRYGEGPYHMVLPGTHENILPKSWSLPRVTIDDGPHLVHGIMPTRQETAAATLGRPHVGARYEVTDASLERLRLTVPVPPGYFLHFGVHGSFLGNIRMSLGGQTVAPLAVNSANLTNTVISSAGLYDLELTGTGTATIYSMTARLSRYGNDTAQHRQFVTGRGNSGVDFVPDSVDVVVSSAAADFYHGAATLMEVGQWAQ